MPYAFAMNVVFDFGNVLVEWNPVRLIVEHYPGRDQLSRTPAELALAMIEHQDWQDFDRGLLDSDELAARTAARLDLDRIALQAFIDRIPHVLPVLHDSVAAVVALTGAPGDAGTARNAQQHRVLYLSNMPVAFAGVLENRCPWIARFEGGIFSGREQLSKPDAAIYEALERRYALDPSATLFLDDSAANVAAARARGWQAELIDCPERVAAALAAHGVLAG